MHRWINDGFIAAEQLTPGAPWRIRLTDELRARFVEEAPPGWLPMLEATLRSACPGRRCCSVSSAASSQAVHVRSGRRKGLRIKVPKAQQGLFEDLTHKRGAV